MTPETTSSTQTNSVLQWLSSDQNETNYWNAVAREWIKRHSNDKASAEVSLAEQIKKELGIKAQRALPQPGAFQDMLYHAIALVNCEEVAKQIMANLR